MRTATDDVVDNTLDLDAQLALEPDVLPDPDVLRRAVRAIAAASSTAAECRLFLEQLGIPVTAIGLVRRSPQPVS
jgi:hypothetical protein